MRPLLPGVWRGCPLRGIRVREGWEGLTPPGQGQQGKCGGQSHCRASGEQRAGPPAGPPLYLQAERVLERPLASPRHLCRCEVAGTLMPRLAWKSGGSHKRAACGGTWKRDGGPVILFIQASRLLPSPTGLSTPWPHCRHFTVNLLINWSVTLPRQTASSMKTGH